MHYYRTLIFLRLILFSLIKLSIISIYQIKYDRLLWLNYYLNIRYFKCKFENSIDI